MKNVWLGVVPLHVVVIDTSVEPGPTSRPLEREMASSVQRGDEIRVPQASGSRKASTFHPRSNAICSSAFLACDWRERTHAKIHSADHHKTRQNNQIEHDVIHQHFSSGRSFKHQWSLR